MVPPSWIAADERLCPMKIVSLNVGRPRIVLDRGREVSTGIFKSPVAGPMMLRTLNFDGDRQAYPSEYYDFWRRELPNTELTWGNFGENLTTEGLLEQAARIGDQFRIGGAIVKVAQPRIPCFKLGIRLGRDDMPKRFLASGRSGIYFSVVKEGLVNTGDTIEMISRSESDVTVADVNRAYVHGDQNPDLLCRVVQANVLPPGLQKELAEQLAIRKV
jgi:MOSC domain-containing protein YiiM